MKKGWISIQRSIQDWEWYDSPNTLRVFLHLLLNTSHKTTKWRNIELSAGELIIGRKKLAHELSLTERQVRTALKNLQMTGEITIKTTNNYSLVTICNWFNYQQIDSDKRPLNGQQNVLPLTTIQQVKTNKQRKRFMPPSVDEIQQHFELKLRESQCKSLSAAEEARKFESFYASKNWMVGRSKMSDWKKAVEGWILRNRKSENTFISTQIYKTPESW